MHHGKTRGGNEKHIKHVRNQRKILKRRGRNNNYREIGGNALKQGK